MKINADFNRRIIVHSDALDWLESPMAGVSRRPLDRIGGEVARATSIVRYEPASHFSAHVHSGGEEFIVLEGVFQDEHGDFPAGSYIRNPPGSKHTPGSKPGCIIFVKLWQFEPEDRTHVRLSIDHMQAVLHKDFDDIGFIPLYKDDIEVVNIIEFGPNAKWQVCVQNGAELFVLDGSLNESGDILNKHSWLRIPAGEPINASASNKGARVWVKMGHLERVKQEVARVEQAS